MRKQGGRAKQAKTEGSQARGLPPRGRPWWLVGGALALAAAVGALALRERPESNLEDELRAVATAVSAPPGDTTARRRQRIEQAVERYVAEDARLRIAEIPTLTAPGPALVDALVSIVKPGEEAHVELARIEAEIDSKRASVKLDTRLAGDVGRDLHAPHRQVTLQLIRTASGWRIIDADVPAQTLAEPEPRP